VAIGLATPFTKDKGFRIDVKSYPFPMRYICVPQTGQLPRVAGFPFFMVTWLGLFISRIARHLRQ
jgi:hypothetical protein